jgi:hypothetical protein
VGKIKIKLLQDADSELPNSCIQDSNIIYIYIYIYIYIQTHTGDFTSEHQSN